MQGRKSEMLEQEAVCVSEKFVPTAQQQLFTANS